MSEESPKHEYEVQWESTGGILRSESVPGDEKYTDAEQKHLEILYTERDTPHFEVVGLPFAVREAE